MRPDVGTALATRPADELRLDVGQPDFIRPMVHIDRDRVTAAVVGAVDQQTANAGLAHLCEADLGRAAGERGHAPLKRGAVRIGKPLRGLR